MKNHNLNIWKTTTTTVASLFIILLLTACGGGGAGEDGNPVTPAGQDQGGLANTSYGTATLSWLPPTENTDGTTLTNLAGFNIYYGTTIDNYPNVITIDNPGIATYVFDNLPAGNTYYFVITAIDSDGMESEYSVAGSKTIPA